MYAYFELGFNFWYVRRHTRLTEKSLGFNRRVELDHGREIYKRGETDDGEKGRRHPGDFLSVNATRRFGLIPSSLGEGLLERRFFRQAELNAA